MLLAAIRKEFLLLWRDRGALISMFVLPIVFMAVFGSIFRFGVDAARTQTVVLVTAPGHTASARIAEAVAAMPGLRVLAVADRVAAEAAMAAQHDIVAALIVPTDFAPAHGRSALILLDPNLPSSVRLPIEGALRAAVVRTLLPADPALHQAIANATSVVAPAHAKAMLPQPSGFQVSVPGNAVLFAFFIALTVALSFLEERQSGTWQRQLASPVPRATLLIAKLVPFWLVSAVQLLFLFGFSYAVFQLKIAGSVAALLIISLCVSLCAVSLGLLYATFGRTQKQLGSIGSIVTLVMGLLGGCMIPRLIMPESFRFIGKLVPQAWALDGYYAALIAPHTGIADVIGPASALLGFAVLFLLIGIVRFRFDK